MPEWTASVVREFQLLTAQEISGARVEGTTKARVSLATTFGATVAASARHAGDR